MNLSPQFCDLCGLPLRKQVLTFPSPENKCKFCCNGCRQVFKMLVEKHGADDLASFKNSELFKKCRELGIIPGSEEELVEKQDASVKEQEKVAPSKEERQLRLNLK